MKEKLNTGIKEAGLTYQDIYESGLMTYKKSLVEKQIALLASSRIGHEDIELCELRQRLCAAEFVNETNTNVDYNDEIRQLNKSIEQRTSHLDNIRKAENVARNKALESKILDKNDNNRTKEEKLFLLKLAERGYEMELSLEVLLLNKS